MRDLVELADLNALLRAVDGLCSARRWDDLVELADACEAALERGKQLWPIADHVDYRLALEAPGEYAAEVLTHTQRFSHGPLTEVAASTHEWSELGPHIEVPEVAAYVAHERVLRGESMDERDLSLPNVLDVPLTLHPWEPTYALATFKPTYVEVAEPWEPSGPYEERSRGAGPEIDDHHTVSALVDLVQPWVAESNGAARAVVVEGDAAAAASALTLERLRMARLTPAEAVQRMAWAAANGGAHGRRRGAAFGRFLAWFAAAVLANVAWPPDPEELGEAIGELTWFVFDEGAPQEGWHLRLAVEDREHAWAAAVAATDLLGDDEEDEAAESPGPPAVGGAGP